MKARFCHACVKFSTFIFVHSVSLPPHFTLGARDNGAAGSPHFIFIKLRILKMTARCQRTVSSGA